MIKSVSLSTPTLTRLQAERRAWYVLVNYLSGPCVFFYNLHFTYWRQVVSAWIPATNFKKKKIIHLHSTFQMSNPIKWGEKTELGWKGMTKDGYVCLVIRNTTTSQWRWSVIIPGDNGVGEPYTCANNTAAEAKYCANLAVNTHRLTVLKDVVQFAENMAEGDCEYGDGCVGARRQHRQCTSCQAREALGLKKKIDA